MKSSICKTNFVFLFMVGAVFTGTALWLSLQAISGDHEKNKAVFPSNVGGVIASQQVPDSHTDSPAISRSQSRSEKLIGTWTKVRIGSTDPACQSLDDGWRLNITFTDDGRFIWNSWRYGQDSSPLNDSVVGKFTIENSFIITYHFDEPSAEALQRLPELFAFWPNQLLGKHTFRFEDDCLILGFDGGKIWFYLKKSDIESD